MNAKQYKNISVFTKIAPNGTEIRTGTLNGTVWFAAKDMLKIMDYNSLNTMKSHLKAHEYRTMTMNGTGCKLDFISYDGIKHLCHGSDRFAMVEQWADEVEGQVFGIDINSLANVKYPSQLPKEDDGDVLYDSAPLLACRDKDGVYEFPFDSYQIRVIEQDGEPWFVAADVCATFGETNRNRAMQDLADDEKGYTQIDTLGGKQNMSIINESGLYLMLFAMRPAKARGVSDEYVEKRIEKLNAFKRWVTHEVIPSIRKTGGYIANIRSFVDTVFSNTTLEVRAALVSTYEQNAKLQSDNRALCTQAKLLAGDNSAWSDRTIINTLVPAIAARCYTTVGSVYNDFYRELKKRYGIDLPRRRDNYQGNERRTIIDFATEEEIALLVKMIATMAYRRDVDFVRLLNPVNAERTQGLIEEGDSL